MGKFTDVCNISNRKQACFFSNLIKKTYNMPRSTNNAALKKSGIGMSINQTIHPLDSGRYNHMFLQNLNALSLLLLKRAFYKI